MIWAWTGLVLSFLAVVACFVALLLMFGLQAFLLSFCKLIFLLFATIFLHKIIEKDHPRSRW